MRLVIEKIKGIIQQRCECGKLLLRKTDRGLEFKCNRCKRIHLIALELSGHLEQDVCSLKENNPTYLLDH